MGPESKREGMVSAFHGFPHVQLEENLFNGHVTREEDNVFSPESPRAS
jgi:hypothetical protein